MTDKPVVSAQYVDFRPTPTRGVVKITFEAPYEYGDQILRVLGFPPGPGGNERWVAIVPLAEPPPEPEAPSDKPSRTMHAAMLCKDALFKEYLIETTQAVPFRYTDDWVVEELKARLGITSRKVLDMSDDAAQKFDTLLRDFERWKLTGGI